MYVGYLRVLFNALAVRSLILENTFIGADSAMVTYLAVLMQVSSKDPMRYSSYWFPKNR